MKDFSLTMDDVEQAVSRIFGESAHGDVQLDSEPWEFSIEINRIHPKDFERFVRGQLYAWLVPERVERNGIALIVWWNDDTKTVVKLHDEEWDTEKGLAMALARKMWGRSKTVKYTRMLKDQKGDGDAGRS